jgi:hypothetical protein
MVKEAEMIRTTLAITLTSLSLVAIFTRPLAATGTETLTTTWSLIPESERSHPAAVTLAVPSFRPTTVTNCELSFNHSRRRWNVETGGNEILDLPKGGKLKVDFDFVRNGALSAIENRTVTVKRHPDFGWRHAWLGWVDESGMADDQEHARSEAFPIDVEAGDVLLFSVRFTKRPKLLGVDKSDDLLQIDALSLSASCWTCGSNDSPCSDR